MIKKSLVFFFVLVFFSLTVFAEGKVFVVGNEEGQYGTIQEALDAAVSGDKVFITPGVYRENLYLKNSVDISGASTDSVLIEPADKSKPVFMIRNTKGSVVENFSIKTEGTGIQFTGPDLIIRNLEIETGKYGIFYIGRGAELKIVDCAIQALLHDEATQPSIAYGVMSTGEGTIKVDNSTFANMKNGIYITSKSLGEFTGNHFFANNSGIYFTGSATATIVGNTFENNMDGVFVKGSGHIELINNEFLANDEFGLKLSLPECGACGTCKGARFTGTLEGKGNLFLTIEDICPLEYAWPEGFYGIKTS